MSRMPNETGVPSISSISFAIRSPIGTPRLRMPTIIRSSSPRLRSTTSMAMRTKVLLVEDNADVRRLYAIGLNQRGFEVKLASNGAEAVDRVATERPDYILLDWLMPLMDGHEVIERLETQQSADDVEIIVISAQPAPPA